MLKSHEVWKAIDTHTLAIYFCFENLSSGEYCVQNVEFFRLPLTHEYQSNALKNAMELFMEESPLSRCEWLSSLEEAIKLHDKTFQN
ncbi:hypothetical protein [Pseudomonas alvandae]|uniref:PH domain-containing protein n=1 Tax=Pseudomonas canavaninivorans TaxID=2842348 RepID=A0ABX8QM44_PSECO|nr:hypothetical protein [Pseudomonas alvandae]QXI55333.1 hypothetical protein KSS97_10515 [Pseudomonas alvandae]